MSLLTLIMNRNKAKNLKDTMNKLVHWDALIRDCDMLSRHLQQTKCSQSHRRQKLAGRRNLDNNANVRCMICDMLRDTREWSGATKTEWRSDFAEEASERGRRPVDAQGKAKSSDPRSFHGRSVEGISQRECGGQPPTVAAASGRLRSHFGSSHFGSSHFDSSHSCSNFFLLTRKKSVVGIWSLFVEVLTLPSVALFVRKDNNDAEQTMAEWRMQEGMAARHRHWPVVLAADFAGSSKSIGEVAHCTEESRWWRCKSPATDPSRPDHTSFAGRGRFCRSGESAEVGTGSRSVGEDSGPEFPGAPELFEEGPKQRHNAFQLESSWNSL